MSNFIFDTHAHYDDSDFDKDRSTILIDLQKAGVCNIINVGTNVKSSESSLELAEIYDFVFAAVGIYPQYAEDTTDKDLDVIVNLAKHRKVLAIGEVGLDYYHNDYPHKILQVELFEKQIRLALNINKPIIIHSREAHHDTMVLLDKYRPKGVVHCFSGDMKIAEKMLNVGMYLGIGGAITFKNNQVLRNVVKNIPLDRILLETDAPYMAPEPYRGKRNDSSMIKFVAQKIAELKNITSEQVLKQTKSNAEKLFF